MSDTLDLDELERLLAEATPGPWLLWRDIHCWRIDQHETAEPGTLYVCDLPDCSREDGTLMVTLVNAAPALLAMARRAQGVEELREALRYLVWLAETAESHGKLRTFPQATQIIQAGLAALKGG